MGKIQHEGFTILCHQSSRIVCIVNIFIMSHHCLHELHLEYAHVLNVTAVDVSHHNKYKSQISFRIGVILIIIRNGFIKYEKIK